MNKFEISIIPDSRMIPIAVSAAQTYASYYFTAEKDIHQIGMALEESIANITEFLSGNRIDPILITADAQNGEFILTVTDHELPGDIETTLKDEEKLGLTMMHSFMDSVRFENMGMTGRRQTLIKKYQDIPDHRMDLDFIEEEVEAEGDKHTYTIRPPKEEEMLEIVRMLYNEYGNTYDVDGAYFPEHHWNNIVNDQAYFLVAVAENGEIAANLTISRISYLPGIWDFSMAFAKEKYRKGNLLTRLAGALMDYAEKRPDISGVFTEATVVHPFTQKAFNHYGMHPIGFTLSMMPDTIYQPKINHHLGRGSFALSMRIFNDKAKTIYIRPEQAAFVQGIADSLETSRTIVSAEQEFIHEKTVTVEDFVKILDTGYIYFNEIGRDFAGELKRIDRFVRRSGGMTNELFINCDDPGAVFAANEAVRQGYFCVRYISCPEGNDYVVYTKMYSDPIHYHNIHTTSPYTEVLAQVKRFDPEHQF